VLNIDIKCQRHNCYIEKQYWSTKPCMTTPSKPIVSESDSAKIEESEEHTT
jgi:hypothetical protein